MVTYVGGGSAGGGGCVSRCWLPKCLPAPSPPSVCTSVVEVRPIDLLSLLQFRPIAVRCSLGLTALFVYNVVYDRLMTEAGFGDRQSSLETLDKVREPIALHRHSMSDYDDDVCLPNGVRCTNTGTCTALKGLVMCVTGVKRL
jgi:hypothetical protein